MKIYHIQVLKDVWQIIDELGPFSTLEKAHLAIARKYGCDINGYLSLINSDDWDNHQRDIGLFFNIIGIDLDNLDK